MDSYQARLLSNRNSTICLTKQRIVQTAIEQIARYGPHGATLSQIRESSGQNNRSAIHYHFGGRSGLMLAVAEHIERRLEPLIADSVSKCNGLLDAGELTIETVIRCAVCPISRLFNADVDGQNCIRVLSQFLHDTDCESHGAAVQLLNGVIDALLPFAVALRPDKRRDGHSRLLLLGLVHMVETMTLSHVSQGSPAVSKVRFPAVGEADTLMVVRHLYNIAG